jgi:hypothetical protein
MAFDGLQAAAVEFKQLIHVLFGLRSGSSAEAGRRRRGPAYARRNGDKLKQIEGNVLIAPRAKAHVGLFIHDDISP